jgi:hypothetical protein
MGLRFIPAMGDSHRRPHAKTPAKASRAPAVRLRPDHEDDGPPLRAMAAA